MVVPGALRALPPHGFSSAPSARRVVQRRSLFPALSATPAGGVALVSGPAGSGKTVLVRTWLEAAGLADRAAWVSIERGERDSQRFWFGVTDALAGIVGEDEPMARLSPAPGVRGEVVVERLVSDLGALEAPVVLVIDDLHELRSESAGAALELLLARLPAPARAVLVTRKHPGLGLHRLRVAERLTEVRAPALRFSVEETRDLLEEAGISLSDAGVQLLHERTEGWAAGLRLAAISLREHPDPERFVAEFSGSEHTVAGYLMAEVLERQPPEVRDLLLRTSLLERVSGPLADAMTGGSGSERLLQELEDANAFVTALDVGRTWFRYHHLFADLLRLELRRLDPTLIRPLHRAAAQWLEAHDDPVDAVRHAQAGEDWSHAARLLTDIYLRLILDGRMATLRALLAAFPPHAATTYPELGVAFAKSRLHDGRLDESAAFLTATERLTATAPDEQRRRLALPLAEARLALARRHGDFHTVRAEMQCVDAAVQDQPPYRMPNDDIRAAALHNLGVAELWSLQLEPARRDLEQALALARRIRRPYLEIGCLAHLSMAVPLSREPLPAALELAERAIGLVEANGWDADPVAAAPFAISALELVWLGRFSLAEERLNRAGRAVRPDGEPGTELLVHHARGLLRLTEGRFKEALSAFRAAERMQALLAGGHPLTHELHTRVLQARARMGDTAAVREALTGVPPAEQTRADVLIAAATLHLAEDQPQAAVEKLEPVIARRAHAVHPGYAAIEGSVLAAAAHEALGDRSAVESSLEWALELAEPEGIILPFALTPDRRLLERHRHHRTAHPTLLTTILDVLAGSSPAQQEAPSLREPLSDAELRVVRYLPSNLKAPEIAAELCVSSNTVRTHLRHIYAKLDAHTRTEAVSRARRLGLLAPPPPRR